MYEELGMLDTHFLRMCLSGKCIYLECPGSSIWIPALQKKKKTLNFKRNHYTFWHKIQSIAD